MFPRRAVVWIAVIVVVLVVVDVLLVTLALERTAPTSNGTTGPVPTFSSTPRPSVSGTATPSASAEPRPSASTTADAAGTDTSDRRLLSAVDGVEAWRASSGACGGADGELEHTTDRGATWKRVDLGAGPGAVLALRADSDAVSIAVGVGDDCQPTVRTSTDDGRTWKTGGDAGAGIGRDGLILESGTVDPPCDDPIEVYQGDFTTAVVCSDEVQWRAGTGAWVGVPLDGVRSLADDGDTYLVARRGATGCAGVEIRSVPAVDVTPEVATGFVGCAADADPDGELVLAQTGAGTWLWSGDEVMVSKDSGATW